MSYKSRQEQERYFNEKVKEDTRELLKAAGKELVDEDQGGIIDRIRRAKAERTIVDKELDADETTAERAESEFNAFEQSNLSQKTEEPLSDTVTQITVQPTGIVDSSPQLFNQQESVAPPSTTVFISAPAAAPPEQPSEAAEPPSAAPEAIESAEDIAPTPLATEEAPEPDVAIEQDFGPDFSADGPDGFDPQPVATEPEPDTEADEQPLQQVTDGAVAEDPEGLMQPPAVAQDIDSFQEANAELLGSGAGQSGGEDRDFDLVAPETASALSESGLTEDLETLPDSPPSPEPEADFGQGLDQGDVADTLSDDLSIEAPTAPPPPSESQIEKILPPQPKEPTDKERRRAALLKANGLTDAQAQRKRGKTRHERAAEAAEAKERRSPESKLSPQEANDFQMRGGQGYVAPFMYGGFSVGRSTPSQRPVIEEQNEAGQASFAMQESEQATESLVYTLDAMANALLFLHGELNRINAILDRSFG